MVLSVDLVSRLFPQEKSQDDHNQANQHNDKSLYGNRHEHLTRDSAGGFSDAGGEDGWKEDRALILYQELEEPTYDG